MADKEAVQLREKRSSMETESTRDRNVYVPRVDIMETNDAILLIADMPGVDKKSVNIALEKNILTIMGIIEPEHYKDYRIAFAEYNIGDYQRSFAISNAIDQDKIEASVKNGVLRLTLPKAEHARPKRIEVKAA